MFGYCENNPIYYEDPSGYTIVIDDIIIFGIAFIVMMFVVVMSNLYMSTPKYRQACHNFTSLISSAYNSLLDRITMLFQSATKAVNKAIEKSVANARKVIQTKRNGDYYWIASKISFGRENVVKRTYFPYMSIS